MQKTISVVIPMYYEQEVIEHTYKRLKSVLDNISYNYELMFIDDGSKDNTFNIIKNIANDDKNVKIVKFSRNFGHQQAVSCGIHEACGDAVILIDADLQDPPEVIPKMIDAWENGAMVCYGKREERKGETFFKLFSAKMFYRVLDYLSDVKIPTDTGDFRLMDRKVVDAFKTMNEHNRFVRGMVSFIGFTQVPIYYVRDERFAGETKYPLKKMIAFALNGIISFSSKPLKLVSLFGSFSMFIFILSLISGIVMKSNMLLILAMVSFFSSIILYSISIVGIYISRIYDEEKGRPLYLIDEKINF